ncbi:hypothetical protein PY650_21725 [Rhizobium calliandrae]|uniref:Uncharacterized protein n=1 Tax=Rhizobium calliandrae TaxID=1312182 RepID=A0ABT7KI22_9HYPH|nr:hypothetical protein [Rhizobium calliandrae]MDL2408217.1 hypothetical protein [Rhizobium calliandrae]
MKAAMERRFQTVVDASLQSLACVDYRIDFAPEVPEEHCVNYVLE